MVLTCETVRPRSVMVLGRDESLHLMLVRVYPLFGKQVDCYGKKLVRGDDGQCLLVVVVASFQFHHRRPPGGMNEASWLRFPPARTWNGDEEDDEDNGGALPRSRKREEDSTGSAQLRGKTEGAGGSLVLTWVEPGVPKGWRAKHYQ